MCEKNVKIHNFIASVMPDKKKKKLEYCKYDSAEKLTINHSHCVSPFFIFSHYFRLMSASRVSRYATIYALHSFTLLFKLYYWRIIFNVIRDIKIILLRFSLCDAQYLMFNNVSNKNLECCQRYVYALNFLKSEIFSHTLNSKKFKFKTIY